MSTYAEMGKEELTTLKAALTEEYETYKAQGLSLNMARGKPGKDQLALSMPMLDEVSSSDECKAADGTDIRNYGVVDGLPEAKELMASMLDDKPENVIVCGNSSLNIMYDTVMRCWVFGTLGSTPWSKLEKVKFICPVPGYDRHFGVTEAFGIEMVPVPMTAEGPDMDKVEELVANDSAFKGIWCVPKYSNPGGVTYSDDVVRRLASMKCAADDFRIFWDNAYTVHHLYDDVAHQDQLLDIAKACEEAGNPNRYFKFASTSKVTFPGAGISAIAASAENIAEIKKRMGVQTIGHDKINQLRHVRFLKDAKGIAEHMAKHAAILRPKFELVLKMLSEGLEGTGCGTWSNPRGGYFISFDAPEGTAKHIVTLAKEAGVTMTGAGATWPYKNDPKDSNIRIAPTLPPLDELEAAMKVFVCCVKLASVEKCLEA
ncbi:MAG: aminotransferase class I/II-fold pyridoxal phosphate-dependent enzyme [Eggerthellaceae bacterium]